MDAARPAHEGPPADANERPHSSIERQRLQSGRNRLGTPRHEQRVQVPQNCDTTQGAARAEPGPILISSNERRGEQQGDSISEIASLQEASTDASLSSASQRQDQQQALQDYAPPSYGTATRSCATLDAGQLHALHLERIRLGAIGGGLDQTSSSNQWPAGQINQTAGLAQEHYGPAAGRRLSNFESFQFESAGAGAALPRANPNAINCARSLGNLAAHILRERQTAARVASGEQEPIDDSYGFLARADKDQPRLRPLAVNQHLPGPSQASQASQPGAGGQGAKKREEGIYATLNAVARPQQPINHVIPAGPPHWPLLGQSAGGGRANQAGSDYATARVPQQPQQQPLPAEPQTDRLIDISSCSSAAEQLGSTNLRQHSGRSGAAPAAGPSPVAANSSASQVGAPRGGYATTCQNNDFANALLAASQRTPNGAAKDDFGLAAKNRKRRRHRSAVDLPQTLPDSSGRAVQGPRRPNTPDEHPPLPTTTTTTTTTINYGGRPAEIARTANPNHQQQATNNHQPTTISAHCWLIDSSDELGGGQTARSPPNRHDAARDSSTDRIASGRAAGSCASGTTKTAHRSRTLKSSSLKRQRPNGTSAGSSPSSRRRNRTTTCTSLSSPNVAYDDDDDESCDGDEGDEEEDDDGRATNTDGGGRRPTTRRKRQRKSGRARPGQRQKRNSTRSGSPYEGASTVVRLSAVLNFVSNLVGGAGGRSRLKSNTRTSEGGVANSSSSRTYTIGSSAASSGSYTNRTSGPSYITGASSMAYSSSTSAYVTGNSSLHSHDCQSFVHMPPAASLSGQTAYSGQTKGCTIQSRTDKSTIHNLALAGPHLHQASRSPQQLYSVSIPPTTISHHSYEYCDQSVQGLQQQQQQLNKVYDLGMITAKGHHHGEQRQAIELVELTTLNKTGPHDHSAGEGSSARGSSGSCDASTSSATCSPAQMVGLNQTGLISATQPDRRLAQILMSDNELISSAGSCQQEGVGRPAGARPRTRARMPPATRRRWWWNSFKLWITRERLPIFSTDEDDDESLTRQRPAGPPNPPQVGRVGPETGGTKLTTSGQGTTPATSYRSLKANANRRGSRRGKPNHLQNIISLAKVDQVFRCRLLWSLFISFLLLLLISLLALVKRNSPLLNFSHNHLAHLHNGRLAFGAPSSDANRLHLLLDDSSAYDLSWLWPAAGHGAQQFEELEPAGPPRGELPPDEAAQEGPSGRNDLDGQLRSLLHVIERSERLQQFQLATTHLSNLQLASGHFLDLTQLAHLLRPHEDELVPIDGPQASSTSGPASDTPTFAANETSPSARRPIEQNELDLASLALLSNLHWPLVKWRHQSQRSLASNFLSFALSPSSRQRSSSSGGDAGASTVRSLLASLILVESLSLNYALPPGSSNYLNLLQFQRLHLNLRLASYHLVTCSLEEREAALLGGPVDSPQGQPPVARQRFCQILMERYRRMMLALGELEHSDLADLHRRELNKIEQPPSVYLAGSAGATTTKNILTFLLDRLALLDVQTLAELTLTSLRDDEQFDWFAQDDGAPDQFRQGDHIPARQHLHLSSPRARSDFVQWLVTNQEQIDARFGNLMAASQARVENVQPGLLYDLLKSTVGDSPKSAIVNGRPSSANQDSDTPTSSLEVAYQEQHDNYLKDFDQLRQLEPPERWYDLLVHDLIDPWPSQALPSFASPQNYDLFLHPNLTSRLILGMNKIEFQLERPTRFVLLNCAHLNLIELSLWLKQPVVLGSSQSRANQQSSHNSDPGPVPVVSPTDRGHSKQIPIRRVLSLASSELLLIELYEPIEPFSSFQESSRRPAAAGTSRQANPTSTLEFGELPAQSDQFHATPTSGGQAGRQGPARSAFVRNQFLLNVSFNKTSLMATGREVETGGQLGPRWGTEFVRYADYFAISSSSLSSPNQGQETQRQSVSYGLEDGATKSLMLTNFGTDQHLQTGETRPATRHLFPCWDESQFRARFQLNFVHDLNSHALFTSQKRERLPYNSQGSLQMTVFERTPVDLSPSLLAIVVSDLQSMKSLTSRSVFRPNGSTGSDESNQVNSMPGEDGSPARQHIQVQIWAQFEHLSQAEYASQQLVPQLLTFYQTHLEFAYPLEKLDLVAVPYPDLEQQRSLVDEFSPEGLGLLRFRQDHLLMDVNLVSQNLIEEVSLGIAHKLAHQFFGNIIAQQQGQQLGVWLFEALCEYLAGLALDQTQPEWRLDEQHQLASVHEALLSEQMNELVASGSGELPSESSTPTGVSGDSSTRPLDSSHEVRFGLKTRNFTTSGRRHSAVFQMLLTSLLPTREARARLLRRCLQAHRYGTMSVHQFWHHLEVQLEDEASSRHDGRIEPVNGSGNPMGHRGDDHEHEHESLVRVYTEAPTTDLASNAANATANERVVFVSSRRRNRKQSTPREERSPSVPELTWLESVANQWLELEGFPLITASCYRDHLQLRQDHFRLSNKWPSLSSITGEEDPSLLANRKRRETAFASVSEQQQPVWPIPLLFISRLSPKSSRFVWFTEREVEVPLLPVAGSSLALEFGVANSTASTRSRPGEGGQNLAYGTTASAHQEPSLANKLPVQYSWFKLNHNATALVRVNYDERNWEALISLLSRAHYSNHLLNAIDRANLLDDSMTLMRYGQLSVNLAMNLTLYLELGERDYQPWSSILAHFDRMQSLLNQNPLWHQYVLKLLQPISIVVGWKDDGPHLMRKLRRELYALAIAYGDEKILAKAKQEFRAWMLRPNQFIVPNLQELVYVAGVRYGDQAEWFHCWQKYQQLVGGVAQGGSDANSSGGPMGAGRSGPQANSSAVQQAQLLQAAAAARGSHPAGGSRRLDPQGGASSPDDPTASSALWSSGSLENEKRQLLTALASTQNTWLLEQFLNYSLDSSKIQPHHLGHVLTTLGKNPVARLYLWRFLRLNWFRLEEKFAPPTRNSNYPPTPPILETMILESTRHFATRLDFDEVSSFFHSKLQSIAHRHASLAPGSESPSPSDLHRNNANKWLESVRRAVRASLATIRANIYWRNSIEPKLTRWLSHYNNIAT